MLNWLTAALCDGREATNGLVPQVPSWRFSSYPLDQFYLKCLLSMSSEEEAGMLKITLQTEKAWSGQSPGEGSICCLSQGDEQIVTEGHASAKEKRRCFLSLRQTTDDFLACMRQKYWFLGKLGNNNNNNSNIINRSATITTSNNYHNSNSNANMPLLKRWVGCGFSYPLPLQMKCNEHLGTCRMPPITCKKLAQE